ncbi:MAG: 4a-hydroxytetrahydrobiopterin dehydratase [Acidobacteriota bacterium]|nr:4a-hydroxytetrahydrobiopterin dehydratase [Acidobacteriota bacterium]
MTDREWRVVREHHLEKEFRFPDFTAALAFANRIGALAEAAAHHPDLEVSWGRVLVKLWTHTANGVTKKDYALAAQIDRLC